MDMLLFEFVGDGSIERLAAYDREAAWKGYRLLTPSGPTPICLCIGTVHIVADKIVCQDCGMMMCTPLPPSPDVGSGI